MTSRATQIRTKHPNATENAIVSFDRKLDDTETLIGTPTVAASGLTISSNKVNTVARTIDGDSVAIGKAVEFSVSGGTSGTVYTITVSCSTSSSPAQALVAECLLQVLDP